jgi:hypothetical protein
MPASRITELPQIDAVAHGDILPLVDDPAGTPTTKHAEVRSLLELAWPVGSVFVSVVSDNPASLLGFGTWAAFGAGRVPVGLDAADTDFDTEEKTGGAKSVTLTEAQIPAHTHVQNAHSHQILRERSATTGAATTQIARTGDTSSTVDTNVNTEPATAVNQNAGGGQAHTNLQPFVVVRMWKRTA